MSIADNASLTADSSNLQRHALSATFVEQALSMSLNDRSGSAEASSTAAAQHQRSMQAVAVASSLRKWMQTPVTVFDSDDGQLLFVAPERAPLVWNQWIEMIRAVGRTGRSQIIEEEDPILVHALPITTGTGAKFVAVMVYVTRPVVNRQDLVRASNMFGIKVDDLYAWVRQQPITHVETIERLSDLMLAKLSADRRVQQLEHENRELSTHIATTFEEISLIYRLTQNLKLSSNKEDLGRQALGWLSSAIPAESLVLHFLADQADHAMPPESTPQPTHLTLGPNQLEAPEVAQLIAAFQLGPHSAPLVLNRGATGCAEWQWSNIRELVLVPVAEGDRLFGWLAAINHTRAAHEFTTVEANLMASVGTILGIHSANISLYRQQAGMLADLVRALVSSIDAKDPYTRGHSDRVARVAARLAKELGHDQETIKTIYMAGLLHDVGKIGIDDGILRKPGKLTDAEFEHVKRHAEIGYRILRDIRQLQPMLPVVLHHHESYDGSGYPAGLAGDSIPWLARIAAVADAYDAMASDRPYRPGMADEKLDGIIRGGAGKQWDPEVVEAFFRARDDIRDISHRDATVDELQALQLT